MSVDAAVDALARHIKTLDRVSLVAEVSGANAAKSGHWYLTLRGDNKTINAVVFRGVKNKPVTLPAAGDVVEVSGSWELYAPHGKVNLLVRRMTVQAVD